MFGMWDVRDVGCSECGMFWIWDFGDAGCWGCGMLGMLNVRDIGCSACGMSDVGCSFTKYLHFINIGKFILSVYYNV